MGKNLKNIITETAESGTLAKGILEVTRTIERQEAQLVVIAEDIHPRKIKEQLRTRVRTARIPYIEQMTRKELGDLINLPVATSCISIVEAANSRHQLIRILTSLRENKYLNYLEFNQKAFFESPKRSLAGWQLPLKLHEHNQEITKITWTKENGKWTTSFDLAAKA